MKRKRLITAMMTVEVGKLLVDAINRSDGPASRALAKQYLEAYTALKASDPARFHEALPETGLSPRQAHIIALVKEGRDTNAIAAVIGIRPSTVKTHLRNARAKARRTREDEDRP